MTRTLIIAAASAAALLSSSALAQERSRGTASVPDFSGVWGNPYLTFRRALDEWTELVCAENREWHPGTYSDVPTSEKPDF